MTSSERYIGPVTLTYIVTAFSLSTFLLLRVEQKPLQVHVSHTLAYGLVTGLLLFNAWQFLGWKSGPREIYYTHNHIRILLAFFVFPAAILFGPLLLHRMLEGRWPAAPAFWVLIVSLLIVTSWTGFVATTEAPIGQCTQKELDRADKIKKLSWQVLVTLGLALIGSSFVDYLRDIAGHIVWDFNLVSATILIAICIIISFAIIPWWMVESIRRVVARSATDGDTK